MVLLDTNIFINSIKPSYEDLRQRLERQQFAASSITRLEALGYHLISSEDKIKLKASFSIIPILPISEEVIEQAIKLRQNKKISTADSIIAATAILHKLALWTNNIKDFKHIPELKLYNPLEK